MSKAVRGDATPQVTAVIEWLPAHAEMVRRRFFSDPDFRAVCEDFALARNAMVTWKNDTTRAAEYGCLLKELEHELLGFLDLSGPLRDGN